jgi:predicted flap endonuclease-1-like 5' DNA nuclease
MLLLNILTDFCSWWWFWWILPFLIGLLLGRFIWGGKKVEKKAHHQVSLAEVEAKDERIKLLENDLAICRSVRLSLEQETKMLKAKAEEQANIQSLASIPQDPSPQAEIPAVLPIAAKQDKYAALPNTNLQIIEGIGPKMEEVLQANGITYWQNLADASPEQLRTMLDTYGEKYRIIDVTQWPAQAKLAVAGQWDELIALQKNLGSQSGEETDSKLEKILIKLGLLRKWKQDDLKAVEGIGPKIESLLHEGGINTWAALAATPVERIQEILNAAGDAFKLAKPETWPQQAQLAANGQWDALMALQDELNGGV